MSSRYSARERELIGVGFKAFATWRNGKEVVGCTDIPLKVALQRLDEGEYDKMLEMFGVLPDGR